MQNEFGLCSLYKEYDLIVHHLDKVPSRFNFVNEHRPDCEGADTTVNEFVAKGSVVSVAAPDKHTDTVWFIMVTSDEMTMNKPIFGGYGNTIVAGQAFFTGQFLEQETSQTVMICQIKKTYIFKESVVCSSFQVMPNNKASL